MYNNTFIIQYIGTLVRRIIMPNLVLKFLISNLLAHDLFFNVFAYIRCT